MIEVGTNEKSDVFVILEPTTENRIILELQSKVQKLFGKQIEKTVLEVLKNAGIQKLRVKIEDMGALDFVIRARLKTALRQFQAMDLA